MKTDPSSCPLTHFLSWACRRAPWYARIFHAARHRWRRARYTPEQRRWYRLNAARDLQPDPTDEWNVTRWDRFAARAWAYIWDFLEP